MLNLVISAPLLALLSSTVGEPPGATGAAAAVPESPQTIAAIVLRADGLDAAAVTDAVSLRCPDRVLTETARQAATGGRRFAFVDVRGELNGEVVLSIVVNDGTAYARTLPGVAEQSADDRVRVAAATLANLLAAIEESRVEPDAVDVPLPTEEPVEPTTESIAEPPAAVEPVPEPPAPPLPPAPKHALWIDAAPAVVLGLGPPNPAGLAALGGQLSADVRRVAGVGGAVDALGTFALRGGARSSEGFVVGRARISAGGGLAGRVGAFDWTAALLADVEPLWIARGGSRESITLPSGEDVSTVVLLGGHIRLAAAWVPALGEGGNRAVRLRLGPTVEVGGSGLGSGGVARFQQADPDMPGETIDLVRAGSLELAVLFNVGLGIPLPGP